MSTADRSQPRRAASDYDEVSARLLATRHRVLQQVAALSRSFDDIVSATDDVATDDEHDPEGHTIAFERQQIAALLRDARSQLRDVDDAIQHLDEGTYGICVLCRRPIGQDRLVALPTASLCIDCAI